MSHGKNWEGAFQYPGAAGSKKSLHKLLPTKINPEVEKKSVPQKIAQTSHPPQKNNGLSLIFEGVLFGLSYTWCKHSPFTRDFRYIRA